MLIGDYSESCTCKERPCGCARCREQAELRLRAENRARLLSQISRLGLSRLRLPWRDQLAAHLKAAQAHFCKG